MSGFSAQWLALREPHDQAARSGTVLDALAATFAGAPAVTVTDLACGTGATMRAICGRLPPRQDWRLVDNDETLLGLATAGAAFEAQVNTVNADIADHLEAAIGEPDLVATSALLDLVSAAWLDRLAAVLARMQRPLYAALSYDGDVAMTPAAAHDATVIAAVNRHQRTDKGFGPALGPDAARIAPERLRQNGFAVVIGRSDWQLGGEASEMQLALLAGWAEAASAIGVEQRLLDEWLGERRDLVAAGRSQLRVGHVDFFAVPIGRR
jgi:hypothetical protein